MRFLMNYVLTKKEKAFLLLVIVAALGGIWYTGIYHPIQLRIQAADTTDLEDEIAMEQIKASRIQTMQREINANKEAGLPVVPSYNNFKQVLEELNRVFGSAYDFDFQFGEPVTEGTTVRREISVVFRTESYEKARTMLEQMLKGPYRTMIHDVNISSNSQIDAEHAENIITDQVSVTFNMTVYETTYEADTMEGLGAKQEQTQPAGGLANADMSDLERSDLETAAEAAFGE